MTKYQCTNCPDKPVYLTLDALHVHWQLTHTVSMEQTITDPWGERQPRVVQLYKILEDK